MFEFKSVLRIVVGGLIVAGAINASPVSAAVEVQLSQATKLVDGDVVTIKLASVPQGQGVYLAQCYKPQIGQRSATGLICNGSVSEQGTMIWATTDSSRGSQPVSAPMILMLRSSFTKVDASNVSTTYNCGVANCALFVYRDHRGISDTTLDTIVPLKFLPTQDVVLADLGLKPDNSKYRAGSHVVVKNHVSTKGQPIVVSSLETRSICATSGTTSFKITFRKPGICQVTLFADGSNKFDQMIKTLTYIVK